MNGRWLTLVTTNKYVVAYLNFVFLKYWMNMEVWLKLWMSRQLFWHAGHKKKQVDVCQLSLKSGPCRANVPSYWYDAMAGQCRPFLYSGCLGNANRFSTEEECLARCSKRSIEIEESERRIPHKTELSSFSFPNPHYLVLSSYRLERKEWLVNLRFRGAEISIS